MKQRTITSSELLSEVVVKGLQEKKGLDIVRMDLRNVPGAVTDFFVVCTGTSDKHVQALAYSSEKLALEELQDKPMSISGYQAGEWVLLDFVDVVVHVFQREKREFFNIEDLWGDAEFKHYQDERPA